MTGLAIGGCVAVLVLVLCLIGWVVIAWLLGEEDFD